MSKANPDIDLEELANLSSEEAILAAIDPKLAKLAKVAKTIKQAKTFAEQLKVLCEAEIITGDICKYVNKIAVLPADKQKKVLQALLIRDVLKHIKLS